MNEVFLAVWLLNLVFSLLYTLFTLKKEKKTFLLLFLIALPVLGFLILFTVRHCLSRGKFHPYDRDGLLQIHDVSTLQTPSLQKELDIAPLPDLMAVGSDREKRSLLLEQLKTDPENNFTSFLPASADQDSESARYAAAGVLEIARRKRAALQVLEGKVSENPEDLQAAIRYLSGLWDFINSGLVSSQEAHIYERAYCDLFRKLFQQGQADSKKSAAYLSCLIALGEYLQADAYWQECPHALKNEACYQNMLELYYSQARKDAFFQCLDALKGSDIVLSPEGTQMLRFWDHRRA